MVTKKTRNGTSKKSPTTTERSKNALKGRRYTQQEIYQILFWWVFCDENNHRAAKLASKKLGRTLSSKVLNDMAIREDFYVKAPFMRKEVEKYKRETEEDIDAAELQVVQMGSKMMEIDWRILKEAERFLGKSKPSKFKSMKELIDGVRFVQENATVILGEKNLRKEAWDYTAQTEGGQIAISAERTLEEIAQHEKEEILNTIEQRIISGALDS